MHATTVSTTTHVHECFSCGGRVADPDSRVCADCGGELRNLSRPRDL